MESIGVFQNTNFNRSNVQSFDFILSPTCNELFSHRHHEQVPNHEVQLEQLSASAEQKPLFWSCHLCHPPRLVAPPLKFLRSVEAFFLCSWTACSFEVSVGTLCYCC